MKTEYRVSIQRAGCRVRHKVFKTRRGLNHLLGLLGPEPWKEWGAKPNDYVCCNGECGCSGLTVAEDTERLREKLPAIEHIKVSVRAVNDWVEEQSIGPQPPPAGVAHQAEAAKEEK